MTLKLYKVSLLIKWNWLMAPFFWSHQKSVSGLWITCQSRDTINNVINCHHFSRDIPRIYFNFMPCLECTLSPLYLQYSTKKVYTRWVNCLILGGFQNLRNTIYQVVSGNCPSSLLVEDMTTPTLKQCIS